jgi:prepilin-type N-terminal cleavage/methylation domain-containing protein
VIGHAKSTGGRNDRIPAGFNLIEVLAVLGILAVMAVLGVGALRALGNSAARGGAATVIMNALELARIRALESGRDVHVVFCRRVAPSPDAMMVLREPSSGNGNYEPLSGWISLPKGVLFTRPDSPVPTVLDGGTGNFDRRRSPLVIPSDDELPPGHGVAALSFNGRGQIIHPLSGSLALGVAERYRSESGNEAGRTDGGVDTIWLARLTGRSHLQPAGAAAR